MTTLWHWAARNVLRSKVRTVGVALVVGLSLGIFLILAQVGISIDASSQQVLNSVANIVTVESASSSGGGGAGGFFARPSPITANIEPTVNATADVVATQRIFTQSLTPPPSGGSGGPGSFGNFTLVEGIDTTAPVELFGGFGGATSLNIEQGRTLYATDENTEAALIGESYASDNSLSIGSPFNVNGTTFVVVGIYSTGSSFSEHTLILPYPAAAAAMKVQGPDLLYVTVDTSANVDTVVSAIQSELGDSYSVESLATADQNLLNNGVSSILASTQLDEYATLAAGAGMMVIVMVIVTTQRTREIGLMKALGYSNGRILNQLLLESVALAAFGLPISLALSALVGPEIAETLLGSSGTSSFSGGRGGGGGGFGGGNPFARFILNGVNFSVTPEVLLIGVAVTVAFGILGAIYPIVRAVRLRPTEALRHE